MQRCPAAIVVVGATVAALTGCTESRPTKVTLGPGTGAGGSWNAVLPAPATVAADGRPDSAGWVLSRNDGDLNPRSVDPVLASAAWPEPNRPSLERPILIRVYEQPGRYLSYGPQRRYYDSARRSTRRR